MKDLKILPLISFEENITSEEGLQNIISQLWIPYQQLKAVNQKRVVKLFSKYAINSKANHKD